MSRKLRMLLVVLFILAIMMSTSAEANSLVEYTFMWTDLGPGAAGGGTLNSDGTARGRLVVSDNNGQVIAHFQAESWNEVVAGEFVDICFEVRQLKGPPIFPAHLCISDFGIAAPISGTPVYITNPVDGTSTMLKVNSTG